MCACISLLLMLAYFLKKEERTSFMKYSICSARVNEMQTRKRERKRNNNTTSNEKWTNVTSSEYIHNINIIT